MDIQLNGFWLNLTIDSVTVRVSATSPDVKMPDLYQQFGSEWFLWRSHGEVLGIPLSADAREFGTQQTVGADDPRFLRLMRAYLRDTLPDRMPGYAPQSRRPFSFLAQKVDFLQSAVDRLRLNHPLLPQFKVQPRIILDPRIITLGSPKARVALLMEVKVRRSIECGLEQLTASGIDLNSLIAVRRDVQHGQRRIVGRIDHVERGQVYLSEAHDNLASVACESVKIEGSLESFSRCFQQMFGRQDSTRLTEMIRANEDEYTTGEAVDGHLDRIKSALGKRGEWKIGDDGTCAVGDRILVRDKPDYQVIVKAPAVEYCYDAAKTKRMTWAWQGLERHGPFDRESFPHRTPKILVFAPASTSGRVGQFCRTLRDGMVGLRNSRYAKGLTGTFGLVNPRFEVELIKNVEPRSRDAAHQYTVAIEERLDTRGADYTAAIVIVFDEHARVPDEHSPYLHAKSVLLMVGIPVQVVRLSTITANSGGLQYTCQNVALALYAKMGGIPWTIDHDLTVHDEIVIGIGTCEISGSRFLERQRHVGITTVFRGDGNYLLGNLSKECSYAEYPGVLRESTVRVLREMRERNGWQDGDTVRLVFHAHRPLKGIHVSEIISSCVAEAGKGLHVQFAFLTVSQQHPFRLLDKHFQGKTLSNGRKKAVYVPERGLIVELDETSRLVCTNGPTLIKRPALPLPTPLLLRLHSESTYSDLAYLSEQVLKFTSLSWRSVLPAANPATIFYSELIARLLARLRHVPNWSPAPLVRLRASRWFL